MQNPDDVVIVQQGDESAVGGDDANTHVGPYYLGFHNEFGNPFTVSYLEALADEA